MSPPPAVGAVSPSGAPVISGFENVFDDEFINPGDMRLSSFDSEVNVTNQTDNGEVRLENLFTQVESKVTLVSIDGIVTRVSNELTKLDIQALPDGILFRQSPTEASIGETTITALPNGLFEMDSFFDIFAEVSVDGGLTWEAADGPGRVVAVQSSICSSCNCSISTRTHWDHWVYGSLRSCWVAQTASESSLNFKNN